MPRRRRQPPVYLDEEPPLGEVAEPPAHPSWRPSTPEQADSPTPGTSTLDTPPGRLPIPPTPPPALPLSPAPTCIQLSSSESDDEHPVSPNVPVWRFPHPLSYYIRTGQQLGPPFAPVLPPWTTSETASTASGAASPLPPGGPQEGRLLPLAAPPALQPPAGLLAALLTNVQRFPPSVLSPIRS